MIDKCIEDSLAQIAQLQSAGPTTSSQLKRKHLSIQARGPALSGQDDSKMCSNPDISYWRGCTIIMGEDGRFDDLLMGLASQQGGLEPLLHTFFSFLHRKTDFYVVADFSGPEKPNMGFPRGGAEKILLKAFRSLPFKELSTQPSAARPTTKRTGSSSSGSIPGAGPSTSTMRAEEGHATVKAEDRAAPTTGGASPPVAPPPPSQVKPDVSSDVHAVNESGAAANGRGGETAKAAESSRRKGPVTQIHHTPDGKQVPIGNGGITDRYYWTQTLHEVTVHVDVPKGTRSRDISFDLTPSRVKLGLKGHSPLLEGALGGSVKPGESMWTLESTGTIILTLDKAVQTWWAAVIQGDPEIDTGKVDSTQKIEEYDGETQGAIRKIMFDQRQKALGLPTSDELNLQNIIDGAKNLPGSPFAGPPSSSAAGGGGEEGAVPGLKEPPL